MAWSSSSTTRIINAFVLLIVPIKVYSQTSLVREASYEVLRNSSDGPVVCAVNTPDVILTDTKSRLQCSSTCLRSSNCFSFNYRQTVNACEHFNVLPFDFTVTAGCQHYSKTNSRSQECYDLGVGQGMSPVYLPRVSAESCSYPFTYNGGLYHGCATNVINVTSVCEPVACFAINYTAAICAANQAFTVDDVTVNIAIPTQGSVPVNSIFGWIIFQQRKISTGFNWHRSWANYKNGFGAINSDDFWLGLERLHLLTTSGNFRLRLEFQESLTGYWLSIEYWSFYISTEATKYTLYASGYINGDDGFVEYNRSSGYLHDILKVPFPPVIGYPLVGCPFSTPDVDNDYIVGASCSQVFGGGWWYGACGAIGFTATPAVWYSFAIHENHVLQETRMMIKPV